MLWSTAFVGVKTALQDATPISLGGIRFTLAGLMLLPLILFRKDAHSEIRAHWKLILCVSFLQTFTLYTLFNFGMTMVPSALGAIIIGASPLTTAVVAHLLMPADRLSMRKIICILIGVLGIVIISMSSKPWASPEGRSTVLGILLLLGASVASALGNVVYARKPDRPDGLVTTAVQIFVGGLLMLVVSIPLEGMPSTALVNPRFGLAVLWLAFLSAAAFTLWFRLLQDPQVSVSGLNVWKFIIPVAGALLGWAYFSDESPNTASVIGMICVGISIAGYYSGRRQPISAGGNVVTGTAD